MSPESQIKNIRTISNELGLSPAQKSEIDLKLKEMEQLERIENRRLDYEERKVERKEEAEIKKWEQIGKILEGPIGKVVENMGKAGADKLRGRPTSSIKPVSITCPNPTCGKQFLADENASIVICSHCGAVLEKQPIPQTQPQPPPQPVSQPTPPAQIEQQSASVTEAPPPATTE